MGSVRLALLFSPDHSIPASFPARPATPGNYLQEPRCSIIRDNAAPQVRRIIRDSAWETFEVSRGSPERPRSPDLEPIEAPIRPKTCRPCTQRVRS